ncbi:MAG: hypothetical protein MUD01_07390 [Chloroflexaceae bacterium]|jgi:hypothetical protein|nr:hypothetical protein [Chloroflexaceae bacterium]
MNPTLHHLRSSEPTAASDSPHADKSKALPARRVRRGLTSGLAIVGTAFLIFVVVGFSIDFANFDQTSGGNTYPYQGWTGTPTNFDTSFTTSEGLFRRGIVVDLYANCSTGMVSVSVLGLGQMEWRQFSDRAKAIHQPQLACQKRGFDTSAWDTIR